NSFMAGECLLVFHRGSYGLIVDEGGVVHDPVHWYISKAQFIRGDHLGVLLVGVLEVVIEAQDERAVLVGELAALVSHALAHGSPGTRSVDQLDLTVALGFFVFVEDPHVGGNTGVVEHIRRQRDDRVDEVAMDQPIGDLIWTRLRTTREQRRAIGDNTGTPALGGVVFFVLELMNDMAEKQHLPIRYWRQAVAKA